MFDLFDCLAIFDATVTIEYWPTSHINTCHEAVPHKNVTPSSGTSPLAYYNADYPNTV